MEYPIRRPSLELVELADKLSTPGVEHKAIVGDEIVRRMEAWTVS